MDKLKNIECVLDTLISTCKGELLVTNKLLINAKNNREVNKLLKEKAFWEGKLEVAKYIKLFTK